MKKKFKAKPFKIDDNKIEMIKMPKKKNWFEWNGNKGWLKNYALKNIK